MSTLITVAIPVRNPDIELLYRCFESLKRQTIYDKCTVILINDASDKHTTKILELEAKENNWKYLKNLFCSRPAKCRNQALKLAKTPYFAILDCDDAWQPDKLERQILEFSNKEIGVCITGVELRFYKNNYQTHSLKTPRHLMQQLTKPVDDYVLFTPYSLYPKLLRFNASFCGSNALFKTEILKENGGFYPKYFGADEWDALLRIVKKYSGSVVADPLTIYNRNDESFSNTYKYQISKSVERIIYDHRRSMQISDLITYGSVDVAVWANAMSEATQYYYDTERIPQYLG